MIKSTYIKSLLERAKKDIKTIVLPEGEDERVLNAAHPVAGMMIMTWKSCGALTRISGP